MSSALVADSRAGRFRQGAKVGDQLFDGLACQFRVRRNGGVQVVHIGLVVLVVMQMHGGCVEVRFERVVSVRQGRQRERSAGRRGRRGSWGLACGPSFGAERFRE